MTYPNVVSVYQMGIPDMDIHLKYEYRHGGDKSFKIFQPEYTKYVQMNGYTFQIHQVLEDMVSYLCV